MKNMERREFLKASAASGIGIWSLKRTNAMDNSSKEKFELEEATIADLQKLVLSAAIAFDRICHAVSKLP